MWDYKRTNITYRSNIELEEELKKLGDNSWEIIYYFEVPTEKYESKRTVEIISKKPKI